VQGDNRDRPYQLIIDAMGDRLILSDIDAGLMVEANPAAAMVHGYTPAEIVGQNLISFIRRLPTPACPS
jgi:PAS domain S-box-containing protein